jgi:hypothetical protein
MDAQTLATGDLRIGSRTHGGILEATCNGEAILVKDADNRKRGSLRESIPNGTDLNREYATFLFAQLVGEGLVTVPAMAFRDDRGRQVLAMEKIAGRHYWDWDRLPKRTSLTIKRNLALFDAIVGNTDRHNQNWMIESATGKIIAIDHGLCFPIPNSRGVIDCGSSNFLRREALPKWAVNWLVRILRQESKIRSMLAPYLEPEAIDGMFARIDWMMRNQRFMSRERLQIYARAW